MQNTMTDDDEIWLIEGQDDCRSGNPDFRLAVRLTSNEVEHLVLLAGENGEREKRVSPDVFDRLLAIRRNSELMLLRHAITEATDVSIDGTLADLLNRLADAIGGAGGS